jgi:hypothetical protein
MTPQDFSSFLATAPYNPASAVNPESVTDYTQMLQGIMAPVETAQNAQNQQQLQSYQDAVNSQVAQATQGVNTARTNLQTDEGNQWQAAAGGGRGALDSYEQSKVSKAYAPQFANLEAGLATDLTSIHSTAADAIKSMSLAGQTEQAQQTEGLAQDALSYLQSNETATSEDRQGILNYFQGLADAATKNQQFEETLKQKTQYDQGMVTAAQERAAGAPGTANNPSTTRLKQQTDQATGLAQQQINNEWQKALASAVKTATNGQNNPSVAQLSQIKQTVAQQLAAEVSQQGGALTQQGVNVDNMVNYVNQLAGAQPSYTSTGAAAPVDPMTIQAIKSAQTDPNWSTDTIEEQNALVQQYLAMLQSQGGS